jgi:hypothetical protein
VLLEKYWHTLEEARQHEIYKRVPPEKPYGSLDAMLLAEIGATEKQSLLNKAQQLARDPDVKPLAKQGAPVGNQNASKARQMAADPDVKPTGNINKPGGTKIVYGTVESRVRLLKRDYPDLAAQIASGEITLPDAEREIGRDPRGRRLWLSVDAAKAAQLIRERFGDEYARELGKRLQKPG